MSRLRLDRALHYFDIVPLAFLPSGLLVVGWTGLHFRRVVATFSRFARAGNAYPLLAARDTELRARLKARNRRIPAPGV